MAPLALSRLALVPVLALLACVSSPESSANATASIEPAVQPTTEEPVVAEPTPSPGAFVGRAVAGVVAPAVEDGVRGILQAVPAAQTASAEALARKWMDIKREPDLRRQHRRLAQAGLERRIGGGLIDLRALEGAGLPPFGSRDRIRGRTWVSRTMAAVLIEAWRRFHVQHPDARLTLGDLTQPGGGSISHNAIIRDLHGPAATELMARVRLEGGDLVSDEMRVAADFPSELGRFEGPDDPVWIRHRLLARHDPVAPDSSLRVMTIRYTFPARPDAEARKQAFSEMQHIVRRGVLVDARQVRDATADGTLRRVWRQHWVDPKAKRQLVTLSHRKQRRRLQVKWVQDARVAKWQKKKPGSLSGERRWVLGDDGEWTRWQAMREAGHVTHMGGSDADVSFVTRDNRRHFAIDLTVFDAARTWDWFLAVDDAARSLGTGVDVILLSRSVIRALERSLPKAVRRTPLWRSAIRSAPGHDAHHHLRLTKPTRDSDARAQAVLTALSAAAPAAGTPSATAVSP